MIQELNKVARTWPRNVKCDFLFLDSDVVVLSSPVVSGFRWEILSRKCIRRLGLPVDAVASMGLSSMTVSLVPVPES